MTYIHRVEHIKVLKDYRATKIYGHKATEPQEQSTTAPQGYKTKELNIPPKNTKTKWSLEQMVTRPQGHKICAKIRSEGKRLQSYCRSILA